MVETDVLAKYGVYILGTLLALLGTFFKMAIKNIKQTFDDHVKDEKLNKKETWIEIGLLRERIAIIEERCKQREKK